jgi:pilus assembly protein CpaC
MGAMAVFLKSSLRFIAAFLLASNMLVSDAVFAQSGSDPSNEPPTPKSAPVPKVTTQQNENAAGRTARPAAQAPAQAPMAQTARTPAAQTARAPLAMAGEAQQQIPSIMRLALNKSRIIELAADARDVLVANPDIVDVVIKTPRQVFLLAKAVGDTNVVFLDRNGQVIMKMDMHVHVDIETLRNTLTQIMPGENVQAYSVGDNLFLSGSVRSDSAAASARAVARPFVSDDTKLVNLLKVRSEQQVILKVRVAEIQKSILKELGIDTSVSTQTLNLGQLFLSSFSAGSTSAITATSTFTGTITQRNASSGGGSPFSFAIKALEKRGLIRTLAEPNLTAVSGETAKLLAGGEYPVPTADNNGSITVTYKPFGVGLSFTPVVLSNGRISLKLSSEVSAIDSTLSVAVSNSISVKGLKVRRAESTVELPSGGSLMIAGLLQNDVTDQLNGMPGLKDIPILGALFRSSSFQRAESELVVTVSAYVVKPTSDSALALPTDGMAQASDLDTYLFGELHKVYKGGRGAPPPFAIEGPFGYILE